MVRYAVIGGQGFIGSNLVKDLHATPITKDNYNEMAGHYDVLINANGNSSKRLPETDPLLDFDLTVGNTLKSLVDFTYDTYIYLSSCEVYINCNPRSSKFGSYLGVVDKTTEDTPIDVERITKYALSKYLAECLVRNHCKKWLILRLNGVVGEGMKKGAMWDIKHGDKLWVAADSEYQFMDVGFISKFIEKVLEKGIHNEIFNLTGVEAVRLSDLTSLSAPTFPVIKHRFDVGKAGGVMGMERKRLI